MSAIVTEARKWRDTPFVWGQSQKGVGCDCRGLIAGVARQIGRSEGDSFYATFRGYRADRPVPANLLLEGFAALFDRADEMEPGDVLLLKYGNPPTNVGHMAIYLGDGRAIHAYPGPGASVKERDLTVLFHKHPLHSVWRWRDAD